MPSNKKINGGSPFFLAFSRISSTVAYSYAEAWAITPWWCPVAESWSRRSFATKLMIVSCFLASRTIVCTGPSLQPSSTYNLSIVLPERNASKTAFLPSTRVPFSCTASCVISSFILSQTLLFSLIHSLPALPAGQTALSDTDSPSAPQIRWPYGNRS